MIACASIFIYLVDSQLPLSYTNHVICSSVRSPKNFRVWSKLFFRSVPFVYIFAFVAVAMHFRGLSGMFSSPGVQSGKSICRRLWTGKVHGSIYNDWRVLCSEIVTKS